MRLGQVGPVFFGFFIALACGSTGGESKVNGSGTAGAGMFNPNTAGSGNGMSNTAGSNLGVGSGSGNTGSGDPTAGNGSTPDPSCASISADGQPSPVDLYFMVDITGSMNCPVPDNGVACDMANGPPASGDSRWTVVSAALKAFVADPQNQTLGVGMRFFPVDGGFSMGGNGGPVCQASSYAMPNVEIGPLSTTSAPLTTAISMQMPAGTTPTVPSITAAIDHAKEWATKNPTHKVVVVYATDGYPYGCTGNTIDNAAAVALRGALGSPAISTYVLGVGPNLADLNKIAANGGTKSAFLVDTSGNAAAQLSAALASIRSTTALDCTYTIPPAPPGQTFTPGFVNIEYTNSAGVVTKVGQAADTADCNTVSGWQYANGNTKINLCGKSCTDVKADKGGKLQVAFGCPTNPEPPPT